MNIQYITLRPDYSESCILAEGIGSVEIEELSLSKNLIEKIKNWHEAYRCIIPLNMNERNNIQNIRLLRSNWNKTIKIKIYDYIEDNSYHFR